MKLKLNKSLAVFDIESTGVVVGVDKIIELFILRIDPDETEHEYYALLNKAVQAEISAIIQYTNQHEKASLLALREKNTALEVVAEANKASVVSKLLKEIFMVEMDHLEKISERIYLIEGESIVTPEPLPQIGANADDFLRLDHEAENHAIVLYRKIIEEALKRGDTKTRRLFEDIVMQEEEHYWRFDDYLK